ncbi:MAG: hypothetical protein NTU53_18450 [Planctomycetota bacterium]|nr:hypothetical protein [Planctomycetota bacterium]
MDRKQSSGVQLGNSNMGERFCEVKCGHGPESRLFNIGRAHFVACDACRTYIWVGSSLMSGWRQASEGIWRRKKRSIRSYQRSG